MHDHEELYRLAAAAGVEPRYWDIQGRLYETSPETARALLAGLGVPGETRHEIGASFETLTEEMWGGLLPPVVILREHDEAAAPLIMQMDCATKNIRWTLYCESGEVRQGECDIAALPIEETGDFRGRTLARHRLALGPVRAGYHELHVEAGVEARCAFIIAPSQCFMPDEIGNKRLWGIAAQLYALKSENDFGIGDFGHLNALVEFAVAQGADAIGLNPLHALFLNAPAQASPYSPNSRLFCNPLYLDLTAIPDLHESASAQALINAPDMQRSLAAARSSALVDYDLAAKVKFALFESLYKSFEENHLSKGTARGAEFRRFFERSGEALHKFAAFQMLTERFGTHDWRSWPAEFQDSASKETVALVNQRSGRLSYFAYLQWLCEGQVAQVSQAANQGGMATGLYNDLAVGIDAASADHWAHQDIYAGKLRVGAPPDPFNEKGQEWGVLPLNPRRLRATGYAHFTELMRANMRHAGALRVDHVMGWRRLFLVPEGAPPSEGAYMRFPLDDLLAIAALESRRQHCLLIGEDLGTVPEGFRERMAAEGVLSTRIFFFERQDGVFRRPETYPSLAAVSVSTHDLATLRGFWRSEDISAKSRIGIYATPEDEMRARQERANDKKQLLHALVSEGLLPSSDFVEADNVKWTEEIAQAIHVFLARTSSVLLMAQLDDLIGERHQANLPGSTTEYPNWRRRMSRTLDELRNDAALVRQMKAITSARRENA